MIITSNDVVVKVIKNVMYTGVVETYKYDEK